MERYLLDTDILIEYLRGEQQAADFVESLTGVLLLSIITVAELYSRVRDGLEEKSIEQLLLAFEVIAIDETIARRAGLLRRDFRQSHGTGLADALIAATVQGND
jgi:predicted nucleic acid-binding protein